MSSAAGRYVGGAAARVFHLRSLFYSLGPAAAIIPAAHTVSHQSASMQFLIHVVITAVLLLIISKMVRGFEVDNLFTALLAGAILGFLFPLMAPLAEYLGNLVGGWLANAALPPIASTLILLFVMFAINALVLKVAAAIGPGFRIYGFWTAYVGAILLVILNWLTALAISSLQNNQGTIEAAFLR